MGLLSHRRTLWHIFVVSLLSVGALARSADAQTVNLTINLSPSGGGVVGVIPVAQLCSSGSSCTYAIATGTVVRLVANTPMGVAPGVFSGGSGSAAGCGTSTCSFTITADSAVTATFGGGGVVVKTVSITLTGDAPGDVGVDNNRCQNFDPVQFSSCITNYAAGSVVYLDAFQPPAGTRFTEFTNGTQGAAACSSTPCLFTLNESASVTARFSALNSLNIGSNLTIGPGPSTQSFVANASYTDGVTEQLRGGMGTWITKAAMPTPRYDLAAATASGLVYAIGGVDGGGPRNTVEAYDPTANSWTTRAPMTTAREGLAVGAIGGFIYAAGGNQTGGTPTNVLEAYEVSSNTWSSRSPMPTARRFVAGAVLDGLLYVVGGETSTGIIVATVEAYNPATNTWTTKASMPTARRMLAVAGVNGLLYAIGGMGGSGSTLLTTVEAYNPSTNTWSTKAALPSPRELHAAAVIDDDLFIVGGNYGGFLSNVDVYDTARDRWFFKGAMPTRRAELAVAVVNGRMFAVGGHVTQFGPPPTVPTGALEVFTDHAVWSTTDAKIADVTGTGQPVGIGYGQATINVRGGTLVCGQCGTVVSLTNVTTDRGSLAFGAINTNGALSNVTPPQTVTVTFESGAPTWVAVPTTSLPWLQITGGSGTGTGQFTVAVVSSTSLPTIGTVSGTVHIVSGGAINSPRALTITVYLQAGQTSTNAPFGAFDTPQAGATVQGSIAVTGWALDDVSVDRVEIWRDLVPGETTVPFNAPGHLGHGKVFIANALFIPGARPDVEANYPNSPIAYRAGWGYLLLTWGLWNQGNGPYTLHAFAYDSEGKGAPLGSKTITGVNANANKPFGALDTPVEGQSVSGGFWNYGWSLTPGSSGCTVTNGNVFMGIDSQPLVPVSYGDNRSDIAASFPGFSNGAGAGGAYFIDSTSLSNGIHQIGWLVTDSCGRTEGIGSRFFTVLNGSADHQTAWPPSRDDDRPTVVAHPGPGGSPQDISSSRTLSVRRLNGDWQELHANQSGRHVVALSQSDRLELQLPELDGVRYAGRQIVNGEARALPLGSSLDETRAIFYWQPAAGFLGSFDLEFSRTTRGPATDVAPDLGPVIRVRVVIGPTVRMTIDTPAAGVVSPLLTIAGWAIDLASSEGSGIDTVHVWAYPAARREPIFLGVADIGDRRPDVSAIFGAQFERSSFSLAAERLASGEYDIIVYPHRAVSGEFDGAQVVHVLVP